MKTLSRVLPIAKEEAARAGYTLDELLAEDQSKRVTFVRHLAMWRARIETGRTWFEIGRVFQRDRTTVIYAFRKMDAMPSEMRTLLPSQTVKPKEKRGKRKDKQPRTTEMVFGRPCKLGHDGLRYVSSGRCVECSKQSDKRRYLAKKERGK